MPLTLPNILTCFRIILVPALVGAFYVPGEWGDWLAAGIFILAAVTDFFDGYIARAWRQQSGLGQMLDPIADKLVIAAALMMMVQAGTVSGVTTLAAVVILCREILVSGLREYLGLLRVRVPVTHLSKWKTGIQMLSIVLLLTGPTGEAALPGIWLAGTVLLWFAAILTLYTGYDYFRVGMGRMGDGEGL